MTKHANELQRRLNSDDSTPEIVDWYLRTLAADIEIFATVETKFIDDIIDLYLRGKKVSTNFRGTRS